MCERYPTSSRHGRPQAGNGRPEGPRLTQYAPRTTRREIRDTRYEIRAEPTPSDQRRNTVRRRAAAVGSSQFPVPSSRDTRYQIRDTSGVYPERRFGAVYGRVCDGWPGAISYQTCNGPATKWRGHGDFFYCWRGKGLQRARGRKEAKYSSQTCNTIHL